MHAEGPVLWIAEREAKKRHRFVPFFSVYREKENEIEKSELWSCNAKQSRDCEALSN